MKKNYINILGSAKLNRMQVRLIALVMIFWYPTHLLKVVMNLQKGIQGRKSENIYQINIG